MRRSSAIGVALAMAGAIACTAPVALTEQVEARRLAADLHVQFTKAAEAGNRAVMADADDAAAMAAGEARMATEKALQDVKQLQSLLMSLGYADDRRFLDAFVESFDQFRNVDNEILPLAVENSNVKAQRLSFGPAREAAGESRTAVEAAAVAAPPNAAARADALAARSVASVLEIEFLQAPHIAEADDAAMTKLEGEMNAAESAARRALGQMKPLVGAAGASQLAAATAALDRFNSINAELITLSRRNSDVRSLALSLGRKRMVTAVCDDQLRGLEDALASHAVSA